VLLSSTSTHAPENLEVKPGKDVDAYEKDPYVFQSEMEKAVKEMGVRSLQEMIYLGIYSTGWGAGLRLMKQLIKNTYETGEWLKDFIEVSVIT
jgi:hypothetical protein